MSRRVTSPGSRAQCAGVVGKALPALSLDIVRAWIGDMEIYAKDPAVTRAMALALMRQALDLLDAVGESGPALHLQMAVDTLLRKAAGSPEA